MAAEMIPVRAIYPPHTATDAAKLDAIRASIEENGWQGRPLLVIPSGDSFQAITGSHRWTAADAAQIEEVPCIIVDADRFYGAGYDVSDMWDDEVRLSILKEIGDKEAAALMAVEIAENEAA